MKTPLRSLACLSAIGIASCSLIACGSQDSKDGSTSSAYTVQETTQPAQANSDVNAYILTQADTPNGMTYENAADVVKDGKDNPDVGQLLQKLAAGVETSSPDCSILDTTGVTAYDLITKYPQNVALVNYTPQGTSDDPLADEENGYSVTIASDGKLGDPGAVEKSCQNYSRTSSHGSSSRTDEYELKKVDVDLKGAESYSAYTQKLTKTDGSSPSGGDAAAETDEEFILGTVNGITFRVASYGSTADRTVLQKLAQRQVDKLLGA